MRRCWWPRVSLCKSGDWQQSAHSFYFDAHEPYLPPAPFDTQFGQKAANNNARVTHRPRMAWRSNREKISPRENQAEMNAYDGAIAYLDQQLGLLFAELDRRGSLKNTLVIITSDHGEAFGERGHYAHSDNLYLTLLHVPLLISFPARVPAGKSVAHPVSLRDIPATVMDLIGPDDRRRFPGRSLARYWNGGQDADDFIPILSEVNLAPLHPHKFAAGSKAITRSLVVGRYHYIKNHDGREELYDFINDPAEARDLSGYAGGRGVIEAFRKLL